MRGIMTLEDGFQIHNDYFVLHLTGDAFPPEKILEYMKKVVQLCKGNNFRGGIIYRSEKSRQKATILNFYEFGEFLASQQLSGYKFALVFPRENQDDKIDFLETTSVNRGLNLKRFDTYEDAEKWVSGQ